MSAVQPSQRPLADKTTRSHLASLTTKLFDAWGLDQATRLQLLGLSPGSRRALAGYRDGKQPLPASQDTMDRVGYLLGIHKGLRLLYPSNESVRFGWVSLPNRMLDGRTPLSVMRENMVGLARIARFIDFERGR